MTVAWTKKAMTERKVITGKCEVVLKTLPDNSVDSIATDPPYGIRFMGSAWDGKDIDAQVARRASQKQCPDKNGNDRLRPRVAPSEAAGTYDTSPTAMRNFQLWTEEWAREAYRVLKPGGYLLSFSSPRTYHRMTCGIEDAGFEIRDQIMWVFGSGFPKNLNVSKAIDKQGGGVGVHLGHRISLANEIRAKRESAGVSRAKMASWFPQYSAVTANWERLDIGFRVPSEESYNLLIERIGLVDGWREMVRAEDLRLKKTSVKIDRRGDGSVIGLAHNGNEYESTTHLAKQWDGWGTALKPAHEPICVARKPIDGTVAANVLKWGTGAINIGACRIEGEPGPINRLEEWSGFGQTKKPKYVQEMSSIGRWPANLIHDGSEEILAAFPDAPGQCADVKYDATERKTSGIYGAMNRGHEPSGESANAGGVGFKMKPGARRLDEGSAARFFYCAKSNKADRDEGCENIGGNNHVTVKPTKLMRYLVRLITPAGGTVLDPFVGSGSTGKACVFEGFNFIGIEQSEEYVKIAEARIAWAEAEVERETAQQELFA